MDGEILPICFCGHRSSSGRFFIPCLDLRTKHPELSASNARLLAGASAPIQGFFDVISARAALGKLPVFESVMNAWANPARSGLIQRLGIRIPALVAGEQVTEGLQDLTTPFIQDIASALSKDIPDVNWEEELLQWEGSRLDTLAATLPLAILGASGVSVMESRKQAEYLSSREALLVAGMNEAQIVKIFDAKPGEARETVFQEEWKQRTPEAMTAGRELGESLAADALAMQENDSQPTIATTRNAEGESVFTVISTDGREVFSSKDASAAEFALNQELVAAKRLQEKEGQSEGETINQGRDRTLSELLTGEASGNTNRGNDSRPFAEGVEAAI